MRLVSIVSHGIRVGRESIVALDNGSRASQSPFRSLCRFDEPEKKFALTELGFDTNFRASAMSRECYFLNMRAPFHSDYLIKYRYFPKISIREIDISDESVFYFVENFFVYAHFSRRKCRGD